MSQYLIFYKPYRVLSQFRDPPSPDLTLPVKQVGDRLTLGHFIKVPQVYPLGRLDFDSEGLMLLSDDGRLQHRLSHPKFGHRRTYWVQVEGIPDDVALKKLRQGVTIRHYRTRPAEADLLPSEPDVPPRDPPIRYRKAIPTAWLALTLTEGRNRQVRRMTAAVGFPTLRLIRQSIGPLTLAGLDSGQWRFLSDRERRSLLDLVF